MRSEFIAPTPSTDEFEIAAIIRASPDMMGTLQRFHKARMNIPDSIQVEILSKNQYYIKYIRNPSDEAIRFMVDQENYREALRYIPNMTDMHKMIALDEGCPLYKIPLPHSEKLQEYALTVYPENFHFIDMGGVCPRIQILSIKANLMSIADFVDPCIEAQMYVYAMDPKACRYIRAPSPELIDLIYDNDEIVPSRHFASIMHDHTPDKKIKLYLRMKFSF